MSVHRSRLTTTVNGKCAPLTVATRDDSVFDLTIVGVKFPSKSFSSRRTRHPSVSNSLNLRSSLRPKNTPPCLLITIWRPPAAECLHALDSLSVNHRRFDHACARQRYSSNPVNIAVTSFFGGTWQHFCNSLDLFRDHWRTAQPCRWRTPSMFTVISTTCSSSDNFLTNSWCHDLESSGCACITYHPSLRCFSYSVNTNNKDFMSSFNSHDSAHFGSSTINNVGSVHSTSSRTSITQDQHSDSSLSRRSSDVDSIHSMSNPPRSSFDQWISTLSELTRFFADIAHSSHCCSYSWRCLTLIHWSESRCKAVWTSRCTSCSDTCILLILPPASHGKLIDLCCRHRMTLHWTGCSQHYPLTLLWHDCISLMIWFRTWIMILSLYAVLGFFAVSLVKMTSSWQSVVIPYLSDVHICTDVDSTRLKNSVLSSTRRWLHQKRFSSSSATTTFLATDTSITNSLCSWRPRPRPKKSWFCLTLFDSDNTCRHVHVLLIHNFSPKDTPLRNFGSTLFALSHVLSNVRKNSSKIGNPFQLRPTRE